MSYQVLARKWRPREFSSLIGQQAVVTALTNALAEERIAQAYLFSGIRGVGKTTAARLFAAALNCEKGLANGPCNECATCREIVAGADLDVLEIDAATYSKVEQVRELAESLKYGPARDRYKVVVLDEVHRLSRQAFDALLKIVEEPPPRLVFIFATTEADAVPATILSRCQEFHFRRVGASEVAAHLAEICRAESIRASERALKLIARAGEGSVRDSVALLDQLATFGKGQVEEEEAARLVGGLDLALFGKLLAAILAGESASVAALAREVETQGWDPRQVHAHFLGYCRDALHLALGGEAGAVELPEEEAQLVGALARSAGYENLLRLLQHLLASEATVRRSDAALLALELAWLRAAELPKLVRIEEALRSEPGSGPATVQASSPVAAPRAPAAPRALNPPSAPGAASAVTPVSAPARPVAVPPLAEERGGAAPKSPPPSPAAEPALDDDARIERFREELSARRPTLAARLAGAALAWRDGTLSIALAGDDPMAAAQLARSSNRELLDEAAAAAFGTAAKWRLDDARAARRAPDTAGSPSAAPRAGGDHEPAARSAAHDPRVQAVLDIFGGGVAAVEAKGGDDGAAGDPDLDPGAQASLDARFEPDTEAE